MPELPEVEITRLKLAPLLRGRRVLDFWSDWPRGLIGMAPGAMRRDVRGRTFRTVERHGKVLLFRLSGVSERLMAVHLRMSGRMEVVPTMTMTMTMTKVDRVVSSSWSSSSFPQWTHFVWRLSGGRELRFVDPRKFGRVWYGSPAGLAGDPYLGSLGADAKALSQHAFASALRGRRGMVKPLLLRQDIVAGIGNIIADESLWQAGIHPRASVSSLGGAALRRLHGALQQTIRRILASGGTSMRNFRHPDGRPGRYQERRLVYARVGQPCLRCRKALKRIIVGGRGTTFCPQCQLRSKER